MAEGRYFDPMIYDVLLELATNIKGIYISRSRQADSEEDRERWFQAAIDLNAEVLKVDPKDEEAIQSKRAEYRQLIQELRKAA